MNTSEKAEITASNRHIERFLKSGIPNYNSQVPDTTGRKTRMRRTKVSAKRFAFHPMQKVGLVCLFICRQLSVFLIPNFNITYKTENWHVLSSEQYFWKHRLLDTWHCGFKSLVGSLWLAPKGVMIPQREVDSQSSIEKNRSPLSLDQQKTKKALVFIIKKEKARYN